LAPLYLVDKHFVQFEQQQQQYPHHHHRPRQRDFWIFMARSVQQNDVQFPLSDSFPNIFTFESDIQATENEPSVFSSYYYYNAGNPDIELLLGNEPNQPQNLSNIFLDASKSESKSEEEVMKLSYSYNSQESATPISSQTTTGPPSSSSSTSE
jgi:hypothetical protein